MAEIQGTNSSKETLNSATSSLDSSVEELGVELYTLIDKLIDILIPEEPQEKYVGDVTISTIVSPMHGRLKNVDNKIRNLICTVKSTHKKLDI